MNPDLDVLRADVLRVFATARRPSRFAIAPHACDECEQLAADLADVEWIGMPDDLIEENPSGLSLLSPEAFAYEQLAVLQRFLQAVEADREFGGYVGREDVSAARTPSAGSGPSDGPSD